MPAPAEPADADLHARPVRCQLWACPGKHQLSHSFTHDAQEDMPSNLSGFSVQGGLAILIISVRQSILLSSTLH